MYEVELWNINNYSYITLDFKTKNFDNPGSRTKCNGIIKLCIEKSGRILDYIIEFKTISIDIMTTQSWFENKCNNFRLRSDMFKYIFDENIEQIPRPNINKNKIITLNDRQINSLNNWFYNNYFGTLKNIISLLKGNNAGGSFSKPQNSEIKITSELSRKDNAVMFIDILKYKSNTNNEISLKKRIDSFLDYQFIRNSNLTQFYENINHRVFKELYKLLHETGLNKIQRYNNCIKEIQLIINNVDQKIKQGLKEIEKSRSARLSRSNLVFNATNNFENAHIYNVKDIKEDYKTESWKLLEGKKNNEISSFINKIIDKKFLDKFINYTCDIENLLDLSSNVHLLFDKNYFTYDLEGNLIKIKNFNELKANQINELSEYKKIPKECLTKKRKEYLKNRNQRIFKNQRPAH
ncbi:MAG4270 family putative restriction endonuclease [Mycoplasma crocodyli]|uniref:HNH nuclease domain-containing protein n=1 Tax=Mycoplasma crocodyli (strain ATCC 51981 / MP145) TaxID=512564 RepID=D5E5C4_MYCCM|nr:hypothetical protein [Mycoplasma crocodyli]ADE19867.1 conserved hypothetical protein [Mycoplasma crocodyli MP145]